MQRLAMTSVLSIALCACTFEPGNAPDARDATALATNGAPNELGETGTAQPLSLGQGSTRYVVLGRRARFDVEGHDSVLGEHHLTFRRWWARIETQPLQPPCTPEARLTIAETRCALRLVVDIDLRSAISNESLVTSIVKNQMLEVDRYPHGTLTASLTGASKSGEVIVDGVADIHGRQVPLRFKGTLQPEGAGYRFRATFDMSRRAFAFTYAPAEPFLDDTFHVSVDAVATEERVDVEEGG
jgi:hypothetical protein